MKSRYGLLAAVVLLAGACVAQAGVVNVTAVVVPQSVAALANYNVNDVSIDFTGNLRGQQMILNLTAGSIYQDALGGETPPNGGFFPIVPSLEYDTYVTMGGRRSDGPVPPATQSVLVVGGAVDLQPGAVKKFDAAGLNIAWAPGTGVDIPSGTNFITSRIALSKDAVGTFQYFGSTAAGTGADLVKQGTVAGGAISFGPATTVGDLTLDALTLNQVVQGDVVLTGVDTLAFNNVNAPTFTPTIPGKPLSLPNLPTLSNAGHFSWNTAGALRGKYEWAITGTGGGTDGGLITVNVTQVPEPASIALFGLALVGFAGFRRK